MRTIVIVAVASVCLLPGCAAERPAPEPVSPPEELVLTATTVAPDPRVGAVFLGGQTAHACTAATLASRSHTLILTAAHCLAGGVEAGFVPGFEGAAEPGAVGRVEAVFLDPRWLRDQDPVADFAIARVTYDDPDAAPGDGLVLGSTPRPGTVVTVTGYPAGEGGGPASCRAPVHAGRQGFPSLHCDGVVGGFSGAPWIAGSVVTGVIGGLDGGGCADEVSYSPPFDEAVAALLARAEEGGPGDAAPTVFGDGCSGVRSGTD
ncbi:trypsin-like serine peptidase [Mycolicibacterium sp.]|uniref:trypsin-like serine peptidase n=1 Tax=Mycolicibacterium sp. TaxID=2320850 RepID=UPI003D0C85EF